jgi:hypothetical protein
VSLRPRFVVGEDNLSAFGIYSYIDLSLGDKQMPQPSLSSMSVNELLKLRDDTSKILDRKANEFPWARLGLVEEQGQGGWLRR